MAQTYRRPGPRWPPVHNRAYRRSESRKSGQFWREEEGMWIVWGTAHGARASGGHSLNGENERDRRCVTSTPSRSVAVSTTSVSPASADGDLAELFGAEILPAFPCLQLMGNGLAAHLETDLALSGWRRGQRGDIPALRRKLHLIGRRAVHSGVRRGDFVGIRSNGEQTRARASPILSSPAPAKRIEGA